MKVIFTQQARHDLRSLKTYIANRSYPSRAQTYIARLIDYCEGLSSFPRRGTSHDDILPGLRTVAFERRVTIAFTIMPNSVVIQGVFYGGRDWQQSMRQD